MVWPFDPSFDQQDKLADKYLKFQGEYYDVGTICKIKGFNNNTLLVRFNGWKNPQYYQPNLREEFTTIDKDQHHLLYDSYGWNNVNAYVLEIVVPVKPDLDKKENTEKGGVGLPNRDAPPSWDIEVGWIWYILIMAVGTIFKDRLLIWGFTTIIFFLWKKGFLKK